MAIPLATGLAFSPCQVPSWVWTFASESPWKLGLWRQRLGEEEGTQKKEGRPRMSVWPYDAYMIICWLYIYTCIYAYICHFKCQMMPIRLYATKLADMYGMCDMALAKSSMKGPQIQWFSKVQFVPFQNWFVPSLVLTLRHTHIGVAQNDGSCHRDH